MKILALLRSTAYVESGLLSAKPERRQKRKRGKQAEQVQLNRSNLDQLLPAIVADRWGSSSPEDEFNYAAQVDLNSSDTEEEDQEDDAGKAPQSESEELEVELDYD